MSYQHLDDALAILQGAGPELRNGAPNHGPMAAEALCALGRGEQARRWAEDYSRATAPLGRTQPGATQPEGDDWIDELGRNRDAFAWTRYFSERLSGQPWRDVLRECLPRVIPGAMATGTHGPIRCGHAVRALAVELTPLRLQELAHALGYCAARYAPLRLIEPPQGTLRVADALRRVPRLPPELDRFGPPPRIVRQLADLPSFHDAVAMLGATGSPALLLDEITEVGARLYLANAERHPLVLLHCVTGPAAVALLLDLLEAEQQTLVASYAWQAVAAWKAAFSKDDPISGRCNVLEDWDDLVTRALATEDEHALKFTEACLRQERRTGSAAFKAAAADWIGRLETSRDWPMADKAKAGITTRGLSKWA